MPPDDSDSPLPDLEWDHFHARIAASRVARFGALPGSFRDLTIARTEDLGLDVSVRADLSSDLAAAVRTERTPGAFAQPEALEASDEHGMLRLDIAGAVPSGSTFHGHEITLGVIAPEIEVRYSTKGPVSWLAEWHVAGPEKSMLFWRPTARHFDREVRRERWSETAGTPHPVERPLRRESHGADHLRVIIDGYPVLVAIPDTKCAPPWSRPLSIEYHASDGTIPDRERRALFAEGLGFAFGTHLLCIGHTEFDSIGQVVAARAITPWGHDAMSWCRRHPSPPIPFPQRGSHTEEAVISKLASAYVVNADALGLRDALWRMWTARRMPAGTELPVLSSALETLAQRWFQRAEAHASGRRMDPKLFASRTQEGLALIRAALSAEPRVDVIMRVMGGAWQLSPGERVDLFLEQLGLSVGGAEKAALGARNRMAHGGSLVNGDVQKAIRLGDAYETLLNRALLKLLGHDGDYVDYASLGFPPRGLPDPAGG